MKTKLIVIAIISCGLGMYLGWEANTFLSIDGCLDAGGRWDYQRGLCEGIEPKQTPNPTPDIPFTTQFEFFHQSISRVQNWTIA